VRISSHLQKRRNTLKQSDGKAQFSGGAFLVHLKLRRKKNGHPKMPVDFSPAESG
jgi:hypothetical protein